MAIKNDEKKSKTSDKDKDKDKEKKSKEPKDKSSSKDGSKEKSSSKDKKPSSSSSSKDKAEPSKDKKSDKPSSKADAKPSSSGRDGKLSKDGKAAKGGPAAPAKPAPRQPRVLPELPKKQEGYLDDFDLPSSSDSEEEVENVHKGKEEEEPRLDDARLNTIRDKKRLADKQRKAMEKAVRMKEEALRDDDNVFDVSYEQQGGAEGTDTVSATDIKVSNMTVRAKGKVLLENTQVTIAAGRRYGLVGPNGMGKSTLLRLIARRQVPVPDTLDVLLVEQEVIGDERSALQAVVAADVELMELREEEAELTRRLADASLEDGAKPSASGAEPFDADAASERLNEVYERMNEVGASTAESRASRILHGLGFTPVMQKRRTLDFSGGWRMRISLARALYIEPTVLLLDEPTNHLDLRAVLWLEEYLMRWKKTLVVVSHDRDFLNNVTTDIIHLHDLKLHFYRGNFVQFEEMYEQKRKEVNKAAEKYEKQLKAAKRSGSKANADKVVKNAKVAQSRKDKQVKGGYVEDDRPQEAPRKWHDYTVRFEFPEPTELPPPLIQLLDVSFKYPGREDFGLKDLNIGIDMGSRVAIVGPNGAGKTTLMNLLAGDLEPSSGEFRKSHKLRIGRYAQHFVDALNMEDTPVEYLLARYPTAGLKLEDMRAMLGRFGLSGHHHMQPICKLSGGQKARVVFTSICLQNPHILLLDEPTNNLDMQSIDALAEALEAFEGGVVIISHDAQLLSRVCDESSEVWVVDNGEIERYDGYFEDYRDDLIKEIAAELDEDEKNDAKPNKP